MLKTHATTKTAATALATALITTALAAPTAHAQEDYSTWGHHRFIGVNTLPRGGGANVSGDVRNFPVLVRLDTSNFATGFAQSSGDGADLRFTKPGDAVRLPHQIERWDSVGRKAEVWVKLDTVYGAAVTSFRMHWGKAGASDSSSGPAVFDTTQGFQAVYHLNEAETDSARDATGNRFHAAPTGAPGSAAGIVGPARTFDGIGQHFEVPNSASGKLNFPLDGHYTLSAWAYIDPASEVVDRVIAAKHDNQYALKISTDNRWQFFEFDDNWTIAGSGYEAGRWTHLVGVMDGRDTHLYVDGELAESIIDCCGGGGDRNESANFFIGRAGEEPRRWWWGFVDELRVANLARSGAWARLEYHNQKPAATMLIHADTVPVVSLATAHTVSGLTGTVHAAPGGVRFRLTGVARARFDVISLDGRLLWSRTVTTRDGLAEAVWGAGGAAATTAAAGPAGGAYTVRMSALDAAGAVQGSRSQRFSIAR